MSENRLKLKTAAVIVPVFRQEDEETNLVLIHRSERGVHGGQLAFPGGRYEEYDASPLQTALRETNEEIGVAPASLDILEHLPVVETRTTGFRIHPFLARIRVPIRWRIQENEVISVIIANVNDMAKPESQGVEVKSFSTWSKSEKVPFIRIGNQKLWGASYRIFKPLLPRLLNGEWDI